MTAGDGRWDRILGPRVPDWSGGASWVLIGAALILAAACCLVLLDYGPGRDQAIYMAVAGAVLDGGAPYRDVWDFKPPGIYAVFTLARVVFGDGRAAVRWLELLGLLSLVPAFWILSRRALDDGRAGLLAVCLAVLAYVPLGFWHTAQPECFGGILLAWALVAATTPTSAPRVWLGWAAAGALYSAAALLKPPLGGGFLVSLAFALRDRGKRSPLAPLSAFAAGGALPLLATLLFFAAHGALGALYQALFVFAPHYTALNLVSRNPFVLFTETWRNLLDYGTYALIGSVLCFALPRRTPQERRLSWHVAGVAAFSLLGVGLQAKLFMYHYAATTTVLALLGGWGFWKLWLRVADRPVGWLLAVLVVLVLFLAPHRNALRLAVFWHDASLRVAAARRPPAVRDEIRDRLESLADVDPATDRRVAAWLQRSTKPDDTIFVWGFEPRIYTLAKRRPASRYVYNVPQRAAWSAEASRRELMEDLRARPPAALVVVHKDRVPHVTGNQQDSQHALLTFPELRELIDREYRFERTIDDMDVYRREGPPGS